jgi:hypothetical protein
MRPPLGSHPTVLGRMDTRASWPAMLRGIAIGWRVVLVLTTSYYLGSHTISYFPKSEVTKTPSKSTGLIPSGLDNGEASWMSLA